VEIRANPRLLFMQNKANFRRFSPKNRDREKKQSQFLALAHPLFENFNMTRSATVTTSSLTSMAQPVTKLRPITHTTISIV
jgi:hypothetical protein